MTVGQGRGTETPLARALPRLAAPPYYVVMRKTKHCGLPFSDLDTLGALDTQARRIIVAIRYFLMRTSSPRAKLGSSNSGLRLSKRQPRYAQCPEGMGSPDGM